MKFYPHVRVIAARFRGAGVLLDIASPHPFIALASCHLSLAFAHLHLRV